MRSAVSGVGSVDLAGTFNLLQHGQQLHRLDLRNWQLAQEWEDVCFKDARTRSA
jgi:hypothetical protein